MVDANAGPRDGALRKGFTSQNLAPRALPWSLLRGLGKTVEEPTRSNSVGSQSLGSLPQLAVGSDQGDSIGRALNDLNEHVVTATGRVENRHLAHDAGLGAIACFTFEDHDDRFGDTSRVDGCAHLVHELSRSTSSVPPPACRARPHHICCIDQEHRSSLIVLANHRDPWFRTPSRSITRSGGYQTSCPLLK